MSDKLEAAFVDADPVVAGLPLRPLTAGSLILLKQTKNPLLDGRLDGDDREFHVAAFLYVHCGDLKAVRRSSANPDLFREAVLEFAFNLSIPDFAKAAGQIKEICEKSMVGMNYEVEGGTDANPNG